jgi:hypothetical protein
MDENLIEERTDLLLVEEPQLNAGTAVFAALAVVYNLAMALWFFGVPHEAGREIVVALMWIGTNQLLGFILSRTPGRRFVVYKRVPKPPKRRPPVVHPNAAELD